MVGNIQNHSSQSIKPILDRIFKTGQLSRPEHLQLVNTFLSDYKSTDDDRYHINRIFDDLQAGRLKLIE